MTDSTSLHSSPAAVGWRLRGNALWLNPEGYAEWHLQGTRGGALLRRRSLPL